MRVVTVMLVAAWVGGFLLAFYQDYAHAGDNVSVTRQFSPTADAAVTVDAGDDNGFETTPDYAYADGGGYAVDTDSGVNENSVALDPGTDKHNYYTYGLSNAMPSGSTINGITVRADIAVDSIKDTPFTAIRLSWDGGTSWTAVKQFTLTGVVETTYTYGGASDTWGRTWSTSELSDANFRVQVINGDTKSSGSKVDFSLDWIPVSVTFTAPWESYNDSGHTTVEDNFSGSTDLVYMQGTGFPNGDYDVGYYDGGDSLVLVALDENISVTDGTLNSQYLLTTDEDAVGDAYWHALVQPANATPFITNYTDVAITNPDTYELMANDSFFVAQEAIPEFPTVMAGIMVAGLCFGIYYWMRKRRLAYVKA
ncbi:hypothetical protein ES703_13334 [subsurface metagenome]